MATSSLRTADDPLVSSICINKWVSSAVPDDDFEPVYSARDAVRNLGQSDITSGNVLNRPTQPRGTTHRYLALYVHA